MHTKTLDRNSQFTPLNLENFSEDLKFCLESTNFIYNDTLFTQIFGTAMGSPISPHIANLLMEEKEIIAKLNYTPYFYKRYVDDCILCISKHRLHFTHSLFNSFHPRLQFTIEEYQNKSINFLDISVKYDG